jgi:hypothetical protein
VKVGGMAEGFERFKDSKSKFVAEKVLQLRGLRARDDKHRQVSASLNPPPTFNHLRPPTSSAERFF